MASFGELSDPYANFMRTPGRGTGCCTTCTTFVDPAYRRCYQCNSNQRWLAAILPISYAERDGQLHTNLAGYKRWKPAIAERTRLQLAAVLWRFVAAHERCLATAAAVDGFDLVATVPSSDPARDERHPLRTIVGQIVEPTARTVDAAVSASSSEPSASRGPTNRSVLSDVQRLTCLLNRIAGRASLTTARDADEQHPQLRPNRSARRSPVSEGSGRSQRRAVQHVADLHLGAPARAYAAR